MSSVRRTNQVLYFARLSLDKAEQATEAQEKRQAEECALFHLYAGVMSLANELVSQYALASFDSLSELLAREQLPSELQELNLLNGDSNSWLGSIVQQYRRVLTQGFDAAPVSSGLIFSQSDYAVLFRNWLIELEKMTQRMREHYQEN